MSSHRERDEKKKTDPKKNRGKPSTGSDKSGKGAPRTKSTKRRSQG